MRAVLDRKQLKTPDELVALEFGRVMDFFGTARARSCTVEVFVERVNEAGKLGLSWVDALAFAAERHATFCETCRPVSSLDTEPVRDPPKR